ncbi:MAG TPA: hypothetical protein VM432_05870 [Bdellovibrionales bacterium]|nr:hypothetical protein [Bdellovibrionales bacterium]
MAVRSFLKTTGVYFLIASLIGTSGAFAQLSQLSSELNLMSERTYARWDQKAISQETIQALQKSFEQSLNHFDTLALELTEYCTRKYGGPDCYRFGSETRGRMMLATFEGVTRRLPVSLQAGFTKDLQSGHSIAKLREKFLALSVGYFKARTAMTQEIAGIINTNFWNVGVFPKAKKYDFKTIVSKYSGAGVTRLEFLETWQLLADFRIRQTLFHVMTMTKKPDDVILKARPKVQIGTIDAPTRRIVLNAHRFFDTKGVYAGMGDETVAILNTAIDLMDTPSSHGIWVTKAELPTEITEETKAVALAPNGKYINLGQLIAVWESVKRAHVDAIHATVLMYPKYTTKQLAEHPLIAPMSAPSDIKNFVLAIYVSPLLEENARLYSYYWYHKTIDSKDPRQQYKFSDFSKSASKRFKEIGARLNELIRLHGSDLLTQKEIDAQSARHKSQAIADAKKALSEAKVTAAPRETGGQQIMQGSRIMSQGITSLTETYISGPINDIVTGKRLGTTASKNVSALHEKMLRNYGYSSLGTNDQLREWAYWERTVAFFGGPLMGASSMIGGAMVVAEDGWDFSIREMYGMTDQEYATALKTDPVIKGLKIGFYFLEAGVSIGIILATGGGAAPGVVAANGSRGGVLLAQSMGRLRMTTSLMFKPSAKAIARRSGGALARLANGYAPSTLYKPVTKAFLSGMQRATKPIATAVALGGIFAAAGETYASGTDGDGWNWERGIMATLQGAAGSLLFMGGLQIAATRLTAMKVSSASIEKMAMTVDITESAGDWPMTYQKGKDAKNWQQYLGTFMFGVGNLMDSGDSAYGAIRKSDPISDVKMLYSMARGRGAGVLTPRQVQDFRIQAVLRVIGRPMTTKQVGAIRGFRSDILKSKYAKQLKSAGFTESQSQQIVELFWDEFDDASQVSKN